jgi:glycerophosphoryl diester phosphodiesterase
MRERMAPGRGAAFGVLVAVLLAVGYLGVHTGSAQAAGGQRAEPPGVARLQAAPAAGSSPHRPGPRRGHAPDGGAAPVRTLVLAHRGGRERAAENSMAAFDDAIAIGVDYIETDVRHSLDGVAFLVHDASLPHPCAPFTGQPVNLLTAAQLDTVRCSGQPVPHLTELVARLLRPDAAHVSLMVEIKDTDPLGVRDAVAPLGWRRVLVESFNLAALHRIEAATPQVRTCPIFGAVGTLPDALAVTQDCVAPEQTAVSAGLVAKAHAAGALVLPWTVDDPTAMAHLVTLGVDGLITDKPRTVPR